MRRTLTTIAACTAVLAIGAAPGVAESGNSGKVAANLCAAQKNADKAAFEATYGPKHAMQNCKRASQPVAEETAKNAAQECRAEQEADPALFTTTYGTNGNGKNAFGKCVSAKAQEAVEEETEEFANAAQECRAERTADPAGFQETYGTNGNKKNAFGKCVSSKVPEDDEASA